MKILGIAPAFVASLFLALSAPASTAGVAPKTSAPEEVSRSVKAMRALLTRCLPGVRTGTALPTAGLLPADPGTTSRLLGERAGEVWTDRRAEYLIIRYNDTRQCKVIALDIKPAVMADLVIRLFSEADTPFRRERFRLDEDGGFAAVYAMGSGTRQLLVRISTATNRAGAKFATLTVERTDPLTN